MHRFKRHFRLRDLFILTTLAAAGCAIGKLTDWSIGYGLILNALLVWLMIAEFD